jgi:hypothetical protein
LGKCGSSATKWEAQAERLALPKPERAMTW